MQIEVDQSGKIEQTSHDTVLAITNGVSYTILLNKKYKRALERIFKKYKQSKLHSQITFSALLVILIKKSKVSRSVLIDIEYPGYNNFIQKFVKDKLRGKCPNIKFGLVGKESKSDVLASKVTHGKIKPNYVVSLEELIEICFKDKKSRDA